MTNSMIGKVILNQFRVDEFIAAGGMASVFRVYDLERNVYLAMKVLHGDLAEDPSMFRRFQREANALKKLAHPNIVPFYGLYKTEYFSFIVEQYVDGPTMKELLKARHGKPLSIDEALIYLRALCSALGYAHKKGVVHCDIKPGNVMVNQGGNIFVADFGIARHTESTTTTMAGAGTPAYMAPEQIRGDSVSPATDVYAIGIILFEMLTGRRPFRGTEAGTESAGEQVNERIRFAQLKLPPPDPRSLNSAISPAQAEVILKALSKEPAQRFADLDNFFQAICAASQVRPDQVSALLNRGQVPLLNSMVGRAGGSPPQIAPQNAAWPGGVSGEQVQRKRLPGVWFWLAMGGVAAALLVVVLLSRQNPPAALTATGNPELVGGVQTATLEVQLPPTSKPRATSTTRKTPVPVSGPVTAQKKAPTPTRTQARPTRTPREELSCHGALPQRLEVGEKAVQCLKDQNLIIRLEPYVDAAEVRRIPPGTVVDVTDGPTCSEGSSWWQVRTSTGRVGWVRESAPEVTYYFICPEE